MNLNPVARLETIDYAVMAVYFIAVLGVGWMLRRVMRTSTDFFLSGRSLPPWVTGLAFLSANLGAQEVIGMGASGAKYGIATAHFYWIGAIPAMVFVGLFMMPFYYGSRARSVPEYLRLRFDEKTRTLNAVSFAVMTVFSSGISMYALAKLLETSAEALREAGSSVGPAPPKGRTISAFARKAAPPPEEYADQAADASAGMASPRSPGTKEPDEVDVLFTGG
jgi:Na+/proline symporter